MHYHIIQYNITQISTWPLACPGRPAGQLDPAAWTGTPIIISISSYSL